MILAPALSKIGQIAVTVTDVPGALAFFDAGGVRLMLTTSQGAGGAGQNSLLYFKVSDIEGTHRAVVGRGAADHRGPQLTARMPDHALWTAFVRDPEGNVVGLMEEKR